ncbi:MAG: FHA domain-containing protein [Deltaproteobacteria bacterium]|nr:MAG: FHA domain-containing protein [Deltaproteobacteria bacterium]
MIFRDETVEAMQQLTDLKLGDLLSDEEFVLRMEALLVRYRSAKNLPSATTTTPMPVVDQWPQSPWLTLAVLPPEGERKSYPFDKREITIGRSSENDIVLRRTDVSRRHARLLLREGRLILLDLKSENGTFVNGQRLGSPQVIHPGDTILIGDYKLFVESIGQ